MSTEPIKQEGPAGAESSTWKAEIKRRLDAIDAGHAKLIPWEEARCRIFAVALRQSDAGSGEGPIGR